MSGTLIMIGIVALGTAAADDATTYGGIYVDDQTGDFHIR
jgi:hypothetical protein